MNKKTFDQTLNQLKKTLVANYRSVQITELDTSKFKYVNDLSYNVDTKNWRIQIDYNKSDEDGSIKRVADRSIGIYFYDQSKSDNTINKSIFVFSNEDSLELYDYSIMVSVTVNGNAVARYRKLVDAEYLSQEILESALGNS
jgi:hypothetical protein